jgi:23S rRNA (cytidine1920-2'-O)/16S rRNA (cytidine1409-2'-O)-methyltransferase
MAATVSARNSALRVRLDNELVKRGLVTSRSQAESYIKLGKVLVDGKAVKKSGYFVSENADIKLEQDEQYVSRAGLKLASVARELGIDFKNAVVLDVGSSTGGFTDYALQRGAKKVIAVDVGTNQLHPKLRGDSRIELHEKTDIRDFSLGAAEQKVTETVKHEDLSVSAERSDKTAGGSLSEKSALESFSLAAPDIVIIDVSFISLRDILPHIHDNLSDENTQIVAMVKPQFEAGKGQTNKGIVKNEAMRRQILHDFESWCKKYFVIQSKRDSEVSGSKGNRERFYLLRR